MELFFTHWAFKTFRVVIVDHFKKGEELRRSCGTTSVLSSRDRCLFLIFGFTRQQNAGDLLWFRLFSRHTVDKKMSHLSRSSWTSTSKGERRVMGRLFTGGISNLANKQTAFKTFKVRSQSSDPPGQTGHHSVNPPDEHTDRTGPDHAEPNYSTELRSDTTGSTRRRDFIIQFM